LNKAKYTKTTDAAIARVSTALKAISGDKGTTLGEKRDVLEEIRSRCLELIADAAIDGDGKKEFFLRRGNP